MNHRDVAVSTRVGDRIRERRKALKWTREQFAEACRARGITMSEAILTNIESGRKTSASRRRTVSVDEIVVFADVLGAHPVELLSEDGRPPARPVDREAVALISSVIRVAVVGDVDERVARATHIIEAALSTKGGAR